MLNLNLHLLKDFFCFKLFKSLKQNFKKRTFTKKLIDIIKNDVQFNKLMKKFLNQSMKNITIKDFFNCFDVFQKLFFKKTKTKRFEENFFFENEKIKNVKKKLIFQNLFIDFM